VEQTALMNAATAIGKPIFVIEAGEHYEGGFDPADPWYPETMAGQRQFLVLSCYCVAVDPARSASENLNQ
jgi:hypothetical protein